MFLMEGYNMRDVKRISTFFIICVAHTILKKEKEKMVWIFI